MAKLIYSLDGAFLGEFPLDKDYLTIGRRTTNDIQIDNLAISGAHASIATIGKDSYIEDLDSTNGTLVNGQRVQKHLLRHGDVIALGKYQLRFVDESALQGISGLAVEELENSVPASVGVMPSGATTETLVPTQPPLQQPGVASDLVAKTDRTEQEKPAACIQVLNGPGAGKELVLSKPLTTLGRPGGQVAAILRQPQGYFIAHVEGERYPLVNGDSVGARTQLLDNHDVIEVAGVQMEFYLTAG